MFRNSGNHSPPELQLKKQKGGFPQQPLGFPTKNDHDLGCEMGGKPTI